MSFYFTLNGTKIDDWDEFVPEREIMLDILLFAKKIAPDLLDEFLGRFQILKTIQMLEPAGRRGVALALGLSERTVRSEVERLREQGLIAITKSGMTVTEEGILTMAALERLVKKMCGISDMEKQLQIALGLRRVLIVQGDSHFNKSIQKDLGRVAAQMLLKRTNKDSIIAITGGSTMADVVEAVVPCQSPKVALVVAARGSVGGKIEFQADTLAVHLANKLMAQYRLLHIPDNLGKKALAEMKNEPNIYAAVLEMHRADTLVFGVGDAIVMAKKRRLSGTIIEYLERKQAVAEAFGHYFDSDGEMIYTSRSIGIDLEYAKKMPYTIMAAGGTEKAQCLLAVAKNMPNSILVTDEGAAKEIIRILETKKMI